MPQTTVFQRNDSIGGAKSMFFATNQNTRTAVEIDVNKIVKKKEKKRKLKAKKKCNIHIQ